MKNKAMILSIGLLLASSSLAYASYDYNLVSFPLTAQTWVKTDSAKVTIAINATLNNSDLGQLYTTLQSRLNKIAKADWHITQFNRSQDSSGLEKIYAQAEARLPTTALVNLQQKTKAVSKPGETYNISNVEFNPSLAQIETARAGLRMTIYNRVKTELASLQKIFPEQHYQVYSINFLPLYMTPMPRPVMAKEAGFVQLAGGSNNSLAVSDQLTVKAIVQLKNNDLTTNSSKK